MACLKGAATSLAANSFMGVVAMETWRPQKVWEQKNKDNAPFGYQAVSQLQAEKI